MTAGPKVTIDSDLSDLVPDFLARKRVELTRIIALAGENDFDSIGRLAHNFAGQGTSFGFEKISEAGRAMERAARAGEAQTAVSIAQGLLDYLNSVRIVYSIISE